MTILPTMNPQKMVKGMLVVYAYRKNMLIVARLQCDMTRPFHPESNPRVGIGVIAAMVKVTSFPHPLSSQADA
jgi:hypothetical protein